MIQLDEYLLSKTKATKIEFPKEYDFDTIVGFLEDNGFKEEDTTEWEYTAKALEIARRSEESAVPLMFIDADYNQDPYLTNYRTIRITRGGRITKSNPIYILRVSHNGKCPKFNGRDEVGMIQCPGEETEKIHTYEDFRETINKAFGWA